MPALLDFRTATVPSRSLAGVRARVPLGQVPAFIAPCLDQVYAVGKSGAITLDGQNVFVYQPRPDGALDVDFCVGTPGTFAPVDNVRWLETPSGEVAMGVLVGDYSQIRYVNAAVREWCATNNRRIAGPSWEVYSHWDPNPAKLRTEICYLLEPEQTVR